MPGTRSRVLCRLYTSNGPFPPDSHDFFISPPPWEQALGIPRAVHALAGRAGRKDLCAEWWARKWRPDLFHAHFGMRGWESLSLRKRLNIPLVTSFYGYDAWLVPHEHKEWLTLYRQLFAEGGLFLVEGGAMKQRLVGLGCPPEKVRIHRIGVDLRNLEYTQRRFVGRMKIIMVGRFVEKKGLADGLKACARALARGVDLEVTIVGGAYASDPIGEPIEQDLQQLARKSPLADRVRFTGFLDLEETQREMRAHDVFLCPSRHAGNGDAEGGLPVVLIEAMALGLLCIGTRHCDIPELITDRETGFLCAEKDVEELSRILEEVGGSPENLPALTARGRDLVTREYSRETQIKLLGEIYQQTAADHQSRT